MFSCIPLRSVFLSLLLFNLSVLGMGQDEQPSGDQTGDVLAGHSYHGEAFNEGPRQKAYLMNGLGRVHFPVTTEDPLAQKFITQGVAQLHGFWYLEAERSFRQAAAIDPNCAMAYWGMALANKSNEKRSKGFIAEAVERKDSASPREQKYITALNDYLTADRKKKKKERAEKYTKALEKLLYEFPDDTEAKAFLALQLWSNRSSGLPISSYLAIDALLDQVFAAEPMHPVHHYRIHLWDYEKPAKALASAARCGQSLPAIAHMWHMPGHIYSRLKRYSDACWQQEASARVDHAHMMRDRLMPDQIGNFAHNNEWLIRNLNHVGRVRDAIDLAKNMIELPRHPKYNTLEKRGSTSYGRTRLFETLSRYELWEEMVALSDGPYLEATNSLKEQTNRARHLGRAFFRMGNSARGEAEMAKLREKLAEQKAARDDAAAEAEAKAKEKAHDQKKIDEAVAAARQQALDDGKHEDDVDAAGEKAASETKQAQVKAKKKEIAKAAKDARKPFDARIRELEKAIQEFEGLQAIVANDHKKALELFSKAGGVDAAFRAHVQFDAGQVEEAIKAARKHVDSHKNEVQPLAMLSQLYWKAGQQEQAKQVLGQLRELSGPIDLDSPVFQRLAPTVEAGGYPSDWRLAKPAPDDVGVRPSLDALGQFRWQPSPAEAWVLRDSANELHSLKQYQGRPVVLIFYLGYGCLHCAEQLQAFAPKMESFLSAGIDLVAISTDDEAGLKLSLANYDGGELPIPLLSNSELDVFKAYRAYDDFEKQPLHGTFLIDGQGLVRWQDISYEPFMDPDFVLSEAQRLLSQSSWKASTDNVVRK